MVTRAREGESYSREIEHTADVAIEVEAPTLSALFERAGLGMLALMVDLATIAPRERRVVAVEADDRESLFHDWLQTLLVRFQAGLFVPCALAVDELSECALRGWAEGERIDVSRHGIHTEIKGVTYHALAVRETATGWWARIVFDV